MVSEWSHVISTSSLLVGTAFLSVGTMDFLLFLLIHQTHSSVVHLHLLIQNFLMKMMENYYYMVRKVCSGVRCLLHCSINSRMAELNQSSDTCCHIFVEAAASSVGCLVTVKEFLVFQEKPRSLWGRVIFSYVNAGFVRFLKPHICLSEVTASSWDSDYGLRINVFMFRWRSPVVWGRYSSTTLHATALSKDSPVFFLQLFFLHVFFGLTFILISLYFLLKSFCEPFVTSWVYIYFCWCIATIFVFLWLIGRLKMFFLESRDKDGWGRIFLPQGFL